MKAKRKKIEELILSTFKEVDNKADNVGYYKKYFKSLNDKEFSAFMERVKENGTLSLVVPHGTKPYNPEAIDKVLRQRFNKTLFNRVVFEDEYGEFTPGIKYLTGYIPNKTTKQTVDYAIKSAKHHKSRNAITGQPTGDSKGVSISAPESQLLIAHGLKNVVDELANVRSGDVSVSTAFTNMLETTGKASLNVLDNYRTDSGSLLAIKNYLIGIHFKLNIDKQGVREIRKK